MTEIQAGQIPVANRPDGSVNKMVASPGSAGMFGGSDDY